MKKILLSLSLGLGVLVSAHRGPASPLPYLPPENLQYQSIQLAPAPWQAEQLAAYLPAADWSYRLVHQRQSPMGLHLRYRPAYRGKELHNADIAVHQLGSMGIEIQVPHWPLARREAQGPAPETSALMEQIGADSLASEAALWLSPEAIIAGEFFRFYGHDGLQFHGFAHAGEWIYLEDQRRHFGPDSMVSGMAFAPCPLSSANVFYGGAFVDNSDGDSPALNNERIAVNFRAEYSNSLFRLQNNYVEIAEFSNPVVPPITSTTGQFNFTRAQDAFEDVNAFYHLYDFRQHLQSVGFDSLPGAKIAFDVHALSGADNSYFVSNERRIYMGEGGVDDAEDADVVIHEYVHALVWGASGSYPRQSERSAMEEALADYFALGHSLRFEPHQDDRIFNWDGHNPFWPGRMAISNKDYLNIRFTSNIYAHTDLFASCLREILLNTDRATADRLVLGSLYFLNGSTSYRDFALRMLQLDMQYYSGQNQAVIRNAFIRRNVLPADIGLDESQSTTKRPELYDQQAFATGGAAILRHQSKEKAEWQLRNSQGQRLQSGALSQELTPISGQELKPGLYILDLRLGGQKVQAYKLLRL